MNLVKSYFDKVSSNYSTASKAGVWKFFRKLESETMLSLLSKTHPQSVLELGCGAGFYSHLLSKFKPKALVLVDLSEQMLDQVHIDGANKICANIEDLQFEPQFDLVFCAGAMEFVSSPEKVFANVARALNKGGQFLLLAPATTPLGQIYKRFHKFHGINIGLFDRNRILNLCEKNNLQLVEEVSTLPISTCFRIIKV